MKQRETETCRIIRRHYGLNRPVTHEEALAEVANIERKRKLGSLDDFSEMLAVKLDLI